MYKPPKLTRHRLKGSVRAAALVFALLLACPLQAGAMTYSPPSEPPVGAEPEAYTLTWDGMTLGEGEDICMQTVMAGMLPEPKDGYYPGGLTVEVTGEIVVGKGASLTLGKLAIGGPEESPILRLSPGGKIRVEAGGTLTLISVSLDYGGGNPAIIQEHGGAVLLSDTPAPEELISWGGPVVYNQPDRAEALFLEEGTPLTAGLLPESRKVCLIDMGEKLFQELGIVWSLEGIDASQGSVTVPGKYFDENGSEIPSLYPLEAEVSWYTPEEIPITASFWVGDKAASARLEFRMPEETDIDIRGEVSEDGGRTWKSWDNCLLDASCCVFYMPDSTPRHYRIAASSTDGSRHWASRGVSLPEAGVVPGDIGGNRGGSTAVPPPSREPEASVPAVPAAPEPESTGQPDVPAEAVSIEFPKAVETPAPEREGREASLPAAVQWIIVGTGLVLCVLAGIPIVYVIRKRKL